MRYAIVPIAVTVLAAASPSYGQQWAEKMFETRSHDFGSVPRDAKAEFSFVLKNIYMGDVHIAGVHSSCGCATPRIEKPLLKTYEEAAIVAKLNTDRLRGHQSSTITVTIDKPARATVQLHVKAYIYGAVMFDPPAVQLGNVDQGEAVEKTVSVTYTRGTHWKILEVKSADPHLSAEVVEKQRAAGKVVYELQARLDKDAPVGYVNSHLFLVTNDTRASEIALTVEGVVVGSLTASPSSLFFGTLKPGETAEKRLVVRGKKAFVLKSIETDCDCFNCEVPATAEAKPLYLVPVRFTAGENPGRVAKTLRVTTDLPNGIAEVTAYAVVTE